MLKALEHFGRYVLMLGQMFLSMERFAIYFHQVMRQIVMMGIGSLPIVLVSSIFVGMVTTLNASYQLSSGGAVFPDTIIGSFVSVSTLTEFAPTITSLLLAGKVGANIASEIGTMRIYEQIDALEVMGVNPASYLLLPRLVAAVITFPTLIVIAAFLLHFGGIIAGEMSGAVTATDFARGVRDFYDPFQVQFMVIKAFTFGFIVSSVSCYQGFFVHGGPTEVGSANTRAVVVSSVLVLFADYFLAQVLL